MSRLFVRAVWNIYIYPIIDISGCINIKKYLQQIKILRLNLLQEHDNVTRKEERVIMNKQDGATTENLRGKCSKMLIITCSNSPRVTT